MHDQLDEEHLGLDELEAIAAAPDAEAPPHLTLCATCREEVAWLRAEQRLFAERRAASHAAPSFDAVAAGIAKAQAEAARRRRSRWLTFYSALPAAAALSAALLLPHPQRGGRVPEARDARVELQRAEREVSEAARVLEAKYKRKIAVLGNDKAIAKLDGLAETRTQVLAARAQAGDDLEARQVALEGYSAYVQELHRIVAEMDTAAQ